MAKLALLGSSKLDYYREEKSMGKTRGIIFDMDGVVINSLLNFKEIKKKIGLESNEPFLENIEKIRDPARKRRAYHSIEEEEKRAAS